MRGTAKHTRQQIQDELDKLKTQMFASAPRPRERRHQYRPRQFPGALRLAAEVLREPVFPEREFEQFRQAMISSIENARTDPQGKRSTPCAVTLRPIRRATRAPTRPSMKKSTITRN